MRTSDDQHAVEQPDERSRGECSGERDGNRQPVANCQIGHDHLAEQHDRANREIEPTGTA